MHVTTSTQPAMDLGFGGYSCNWGTHICGLYETDRERDEIVLGFLHQGDVAGDLQLYCPVEQTPAQFTAKHDRDYPNCAGHVGDPGRFRLLDAATLYYPEGHFCPHSMDRGLSVFYAQSQAEGPRNIRATAEMVWALAAIPGIEHLMVYESRLNYFIPGKPWISICLYNLTRVSGAMVMQVLQTHPYTISGGVITQNPYYQDPAEWLRTHAPGFGGNETSR